MSTALDYRQEDADVGGDADDGFASAPVGLLFTAGRFAITALFFSISAALLINLGWHYDETGGAPWDKLHPASWLSLLLVAFWMVRSGNPLTNAMRLLAEHRDLIPYLVGVVFMIAYVVYVIGAPFTMFLETFLAPIAVFLLFNRVQEKEAHRLALFLHLLFFVNAVLGILEFALSFHLTPLTINGELIAEERSTALFGHPLANATMIGCYLLMLAFGGGRDFSMLMRLAVFSVNFASMIAFGGRAALAFVLVALGFVFLYRLIGFLRGEKISKNFLTVLAVGIPIYCVMIGVLANNGYFDAFLDRIVNDEGSAGTRIAMFSIFDHINWRDLLFVPDWQQVQTWSHIYGLDYGIENFIVASILAYGIVASAIFLPTLMLFSRAVCRSLMAHSGWVFVYFYAVALTSVSLSSKTIVLSMFVLALVVLMRQHDAGAEDSA